MSYVGILLLGWASLVIEATLTAELPLGIYTPQVLLPLLVFLGVSHPAPLLQGALLSFGLGYLQDSFSGMRIGLFTLISVASYVLARGMRPRFFLHGPVVQWTWLFTLSLAWGATLISLRALFEKPPPFTVSGESTGQWMMVLASALVSASLSLLVLRTARRMDEPKLVRTR